MSEPAHKPLTFDRPLRGRIYDSIAETIGNTPLVRIPRIAAEEELVADVALKLEFFNPIASVKDRIGVNLILSLEREGKIGTGSTLIEPTSGNTGIGLAFFAASRGYRLILTLPESVSAERRKLLSYLGAELVLTPKEKGMKGAVARAQELLESTPGAVLVGQFTNPANPEIHRLTTAEEIWFDTDGKVDIVVSGIGTGGTLTGVGQALKPRKPDLKLVAVEPAASPGTVRRLALAAPDPGHRRRLHTGGAGYLADRRNHPGHQRRNLRPGPAAGKKRGYPGRHFLGRGPGGDAETREAAGKRGQTDRGDYPELCRAVLHHRVV